MTLDTPCREWRGPTTAGGYGWRNKQYLHRWIIETAGEDQYGTPWDPDLHVMHLCDNPPCFRFDHLRLGTHSDNMADMAAKGRCNPPRLRGEAHGMAKLTEEAVRDIRSSGDHWREVTERYGISRSLVFQVRSKAVWAHVS